jgi:hypothetical protein
MDTMFQIGLANASPASMKMALSRDYEENVWLTDLPLRTLLQSRDGGRQGGGRQGGGRCG